jgi:hypothetical protein
MIAYRMTAAGFLFQQIDGVASPRRALSHPDGRLVLDASADSRPLSALGGAGRHSRLVRVEARLQRQAEPQHRQLQLHGGGLAAHLQELCRERRAEDAELYLSL